MYYNNNDATMTACLCRGESGAATSKFWAATARRVEMDGWRDGGMEGWHTVHRSCSSSPHFIHTLASYSDPSRRSSGWQHTTVPTGTCLGRADRRRDPASHLETHPQGSVAIRIHLGSTPTCHSLGRQTRLDSPLGYRQRTTDNWNRR
jgi:hypothetical protein